MIKVFGRVTCAPCRATKQFLELKNIPYEYVEAEGEEYQQHALKYGFMVPLIITEDDGFTGYQPALLSSLAKSTSIQIGQ